MLKNELTEIVASIWETSIRGSLRPAAVDRDAETGVPRLHAHIDFSGAWCGRLEATCTEGFARRIACDMFACANEEASAEDLTDAIGEIVNMIGGNVKALLPAPCQLSLPHGQLVAPSMTGDDALHFESSAGTLSLRIMAT